MIKSLKTGYTEYIVDSLDDVTNPEVIKTYKPNGKGFEQGDRIIFHENGKLCMGVYFSSLNGFVRTDHGAVIEVMGEAKTIFEKTVSFTHESEVGSMAIIPDFDITNSCIGWYRITVDDTEYITAYVPHPDTTMISNNTLSIYLCNPEEDECMLVIFGSQLTGEHTVKLELLGTKFINYSVRMLSDGMLYGYCTDMPMDGEYSIQIKDDRGDALYSESGGLDYFLGFASFSVELPDDVISTIKSGTPITFEISVTSDDGTVTEYTLGGVAGTYQEAYPQPEEAFYDSYYWGNEFMVSLGS